MRVFLRSELNMPIGKQIAQGAHAACSFILGCFDFEAEKWRSPKGRNYLESFTKNLEVKHVADSEFFELNPLITIEDRGHTVFNGIPTVTAAFFSENSDDILEYGYVENSHVLDSPTNVRMTQVISKTYRKANASAAVKIAISEYCEHLITLLDSVQNGRIEPGQKESLKSWSLGAFAKITLVASEATQMQEVLQKLKERNSDAIGCPTLLIGQDYTPVILTVGPAKKEDLSPATQHLKML